jgi:hypothetical protein
MPLVITHQTRGIFIASLTNNPSFSKRRNAAFTYFPTKEAALSEIAKWPDDISQRCRVYDTERDLISISSLLAYNTRNPTNKWR